MQTLRVDDTDPRLEFGPAGAWTVQGDYHYSQTTFSRFFILFRGTGITLYGQSGDGGATLFITADGSDWAPVSLNGTSDGTKQLWNITGLKDGDHQILGMTNPQNGGNNAWIDYVELENSASTGFEPSGSGANATSIPQEAVLVEDTDSSIQYSPSYQWSTIHDVQYHGPSLTGTNQSGTSLTFTFEGVAVWYYSDVGPQHAALTASVDGSSPERASGYTPAPLGLARQLIWSKTNLSLGMHTLSLTHAGQPGEYLTVDFFRVLRNENSGATSTGSSSTGSSSTAITTVSPDITPAANTITALGSLGQTRLAIAISIPLGVILLVGLTTLVMICLRRRQRTGYLHVPPMSQHVGRPPTPRGDSFLAPTPANAFSAPAPTSQSRLDRRSPPLSSVGVPPPYRSPDPTSSY